MGGFSGILEQAGKGLTEWGEGLLRKTSGNSYASSAWSLGGVKADMYKAFPEGKDAEAFMKMYWPAKDQALEALEQPRKALVTGIKSRTDYMSQRLLEKPIGEIHNTLVKNGDTLQVHTQQLLNRNVAADGSSLNNSKTLRILGFQHEGQAAAIARQQVFGTNYSNLADIMSKLLRSDDPTKNSYAGLLMDVISNDTKDITKFQGAPVSDVKMQIRHYIEQENKAKSLLARAEGKSFVETPLPSIKATYSQTSELERAVRSFTIIRQAPFAAISHALMPVNMVLSSPLRANIRGILEMNTPELKQLYEATAILADTNHVMLNDVLTASTGYVQHKTGNNRVATMLYNSIHMPGLNKLRNWQIRMAGAVGYHSAIMWGEAVAKEDKRAFEELKDLGLNPTEIARRGGQLTDEELKTAVYNFADDRMLLNRAKYSSLAANSNPFMRSATTFHGFINAQSNFMQKTLLKMLRSGDYKGIAQVVATIGVAYPITAPMIKSLGVLGRTASPNKAIASAADDYKHLSNPENADEFIKTYIDLVSYIGGFGMAHSYIQGAWGDRLGLAVMGPTIGTGVRTAQDAINGLTRPSKTGRHNFRPLGRDILDNTIPILGKEAEHQLLPPQK